MALLMKLYSFTIRAPLGASRRPMRACWVDPRRPFREEWKEEWKARPGERAGPPHHRRCLSVSMHAKKRKQGYSSDEDGYSVNTSTEVVLVSSDAWDAWRLDDVAGLIRDGAVGIIPTDTYPALVCDLENKEAVRVMYELKRARPSTKSMSILCRSYQDVSTYTSGPQFDAFFRTAKRILPGPYTLILPASKNLPKQVTDFDTGAKKKRTTVGVRLVDNVICQALLERLDRPLLSSSAIIPEMRDTDGRASAAPDIGSLMDSYGPSLGFVVGVHEDDVLHQGERVEGSTVLDLTGDGVEVVRLGAGDVRWL